MWLNLMLHTKARKEHTKANPKFYNQDFHKIPQLL